MSGASDPVEIYQLRLSLKGISPMIWRRVLVRSDSPLADLHYITQMVMNWSNYYLHRFTIHGKTYGVPRLYGQEGQDAREITLQQLKLRPNERFLYEYSFFEWWEHEIRLEKKLPLQGSKQYPTCMSGARAAPREDYGNAQAFMEQQAYFSQDYILWRILEIYERFQQEDPPDEYETEAYDAELRHFRYWLKVDHFDRRGINQRLKWYALGDERWTEGLEVL